MMGTSSLSMLEATMQAFLLLLRYRRLTRLAGSERPSKGLKHVAHFPIG